ncbi:MAG: MerR family transcriptional regulator, partial [Proteobacteria bacterium]
MLGASLPDARIDAGEELIESLRSIPEKMAFKIGEAAEMVGVKQYVLRYWESEFDMLRPRKSKNNQRVYSRRDVETAMMIKKLLYTDRFSIEGARSALRQLKTHVKEERNIKAIAQSQESA